MKHLRYDCMDANLSGEKRHPQEVMREIGITYERAIPQSMAGQWWFFNCQYKKLPKYITGMNCDNWMANQYSLPAEYVTSSHYIPRSEVK